jgi:hypothetical protein
VVLITGDQRAGACRSDSEQPQRLMVTHGQEAIRSRGPAIWQVLGQPRLRLPKLTVRGCSWVAVTMRRRPDPEKTDQRRWSTLNRSGHPRPELLMRLGKCAVRPGTVGISSVPPRLLPILLP